MKFKHILVIFILLSVIIFSCGCLGASHHDEADKIYVDYFKSGYYYFEDDNGRSFNKTLYEGDISSIAKQYTPNQWISYVQNLDFIADKNDKEIFYNATQTLARGGGDCEDLAILMARGLHDIGVDASIIVQKNHVLCGINCTQVEDNYKNLKVRFTNNNLYKWVKIEDYYAIETTTTWGIGEYDEYPVEYEKIYRL